MAKKLIALSVQIDVMNSTKLKKFSFTIDKTTPAANQEKWTITFDLLERPDKTKPFPADDPTIHIVIDVSLENVPATAQTAAADDFTVAQTQHVLTVVAAAAKELKAGDLTQDEFNAVVEATMAQR